MRSLLELIFNVYTKATYHLFVSKLEIFLQKYLRKYFDFAQLSTSLKRTILHRMSPIKTPLTLLLHDFHRKSFDDYIQDNHLFDIQMLHYKI